MKRTIPLLIAATCGLVLIISAFIPATVTWGETAAVWFDILAAIAFVLGGGNLMKVHLKKVSDQEEGWAYSVITMVTFLLTLAVGLFKWGVPPNSDQEFYGETFVRIAAKDLPDATVTTLETSLPAGLFREPMPLSVRRQFSFQGDQDLVTEISFRGWMTSSQLDDLLGVHQMLNWQCAIEQLANQAVVPEPIQGRVKFRPDHRVLSVTGALQDKDENYLSELDEDPEWQRVVKALAEKSRHQTTIPVDSFPSAFQIPESLTGRVERQESSLLITGPLSSDDNDALADQFEKSRPSTKDQIDSFVAELRTLQGGLTEQQENLTRGKLSSSWTAEQLITVLNEAGIPDEETKTACELLEEKAAGVAILDATRDSDQEPVELNEEQQAFLESAIQDSSIPFADYSSRLADLGPWVPAQTAALEKFISRLPTIGRRNRELASLLSQGTEQLSEEQYEFLLSDYREEFEWQGAMYAAMLATHQVKYAWSGEYIAMGSPFWWSYEYAFNPLTATMFSLLAFYVASAAFRAFRAKNFEALLLLGTAFIILLGRTFAGVMLTSGLPDELAFLRIENLTMFIMSTINTAGNRAIMIGISLGIVSTSLKVLLGVDRSYLGTGEE